MTDPGTITHEEFVTQYNADAVTVHVNKFRVGDFVLSDFANPKYRRSHLLWTWTGIVLAIPIPVVLLFVSWKLSIVSFVAGLIVSSAAHRSAGRFVLQNMLEDESFWEYALLHGGAILKDRNGNTLKSAFLNRMHQSWKADAVDKSVSPVTAHPAEHARRQLSGDSR